MATRDDCVKAVMGELSEFISADVEALFDNAATAVDALIDLPGALITEDRWDEQCHSCEWLIRDHLVDGRCPTVLGRARKIEPWRLRDDDTWTKEQEDALGRKRTCWADKCDRPAEWELTLPGGVTAHEHYCLGHALERGLDPEKAEWVSTDA